MPGRKISLGVLRLALFFLTGLALAGPAGAATYRGEDGTPVPGYGHIGDFSDSGQITAIGGASLASGYGGSGLVVLTNSAGDPLTATFNNLTGRGGEGFGGWWGGSGVLINGHLVNRNNLLAESGAGSFGGVGVDAYSYEALGSGLLRLTTVVNQGGNPGMWVSGDMLVHPKARVVLSSRTAFPSPSLQVDGNLTFLPGSSLLLENENSGMGVGSDKNITLDGVSVRLGTALIVDKNDPQTLAAFLSGPMVASGSFSEVNGPVIEQTFGYGSVNTTMVVTVKEDVESFLSGADQRVVRAIREHAGLFYSDVGLRGEQFGWYLAALEVMYEPSVEELRGTASRLRRSLEAEDTAELFSSFRLGQSLATQQFSQGLRRAAVQPYFNPTNLSGTDDFYRSLPLAAGPNGPDLVAWATPFAHFGKLDGKSGQGDMDQDFYGVSAGLALHSEVVSLGLAFHYIRSEFDRSGYDADADTYGLTLGLGRQFLVNDWFAPYAELHAGYSRVELDQDQHDFFGDKNNSSPDADVFTVGLLLDNSFRLGEQFQLTPSLGLDYTLIDMDGYSLSNTLLPMRMKPEDYESLRGSLGLKAQWTPSPLFALEGRATWYLEMMDTRGEISSHATNMPGIDLVAKSRDRDRSALGLGAGFDWNPSEHFSLGLDYDYLLEQHYSGHQLSLNLKIPF